jgi:hypothetical protein
VPQLETLVGGPGAFCTTLFYIPQLRKCWATGETGDLFLKMLLLLGCGLALWIAYGLMRSGLPPIAIPGTKLEPGRCRPASGLAEAERRSWFSIAKIIIGIGPYCIVIGECNSSISVRDRTTGTLVPLA